MNGESMEHLREIRIFQALEDLDERLAAINVAPFELRVVGGFALLLESIRKNKNDYTDIDYVGKNLPDDVKSAIQEVGAEWGFEKNWINNDILLADSSLEEMEWCTGKLNFIKRFDLKVITVYSLDRRCLLRMKMIALDTNFVAIQHNRDEDFTRLKDFVDVKLLMEAEGMDIHDLIKETSEWVLDQRIYYLVQYYLKTGRLDMFVNHLWRLLVRKRK